jgi:hypothetical protein
VSDTRVKLYRLAFLGNPTPRLPARLVPLFRLEDPYEIYLQVGDDSGEKVLEFRRADLGSFSKLLEIQHVEKSWVGARVLQALQIDDGQLLTTKSETELSQWLKLTLEANQKEIRERNPFFGLEASRYIDSNDLEVEFATACACQLFLCSEKVAIAWLATAHTSHQATIAAMAALQNIKSGITTIDIRNDTDKNNEFPFGKSLGGRPLTFTGRVVSLHSWRIMSRAQKLGLHHKKSWE